MLTVHRGQRGYFRSGLAQTKSCLGMWLTKLRNDANIFVLGSSSKVSCEQGEFPSVTGSSY